MPPIGPFACCEHCGPHETSHHHPYPCIRTSTCGGREPNKDREDRLAREREETRTRIRAMTDVRSLARPYLQGVFQ